MSIFRILVFAAVLPAAFLLWYAWKLDRPDDKEPFALMAKLVALGAVACVPAAILEIPMGGLVKALVPGQGPRYYFVYSMLVPGLIEEGCKFFMLYRVTSRNANFNSHYDGILYAAAVSLGFAALENVLYVLEGGLATAIVRAYSSIPGHMIFGIIMGIFYTNWHSRWVREGIRGSLVPTIIAPMLLHGFYDFLAFQESRNGFYFLALQLLVIILDVLCFVLLRREARRDRMYWEM